MNRDLFRTLIWELIVEKAIQRLFSSVPLLGWGPIGMVSSVLIRRFAGMAYENSKQILVFQSIKFNNLEHEKVFNQQFIKIKMMEYHGASDIQLDEEIKNAQRALADFVRY